MSTEVLVIDVRIRDVWSVEGHRELANMVLFEGECNCENFHGRILPGAVDTQRAEKGQGMVLSARYMLEGTDWRGEACRIFIENCGVDRPGEVMRTVPRIVTDSEALKYLEEEPLVGTIEPVENGIRIHIFVDKVESEEEICG